MVEFKNVYCIYFVFFCNISDLSIANNSAYVFPWPRGWDDAVVEHLLNLFLKIMKPFGNCFHIYLIRHCLHLSV